MPDDTEVDGLLADHRADVAAIARKVRATVLSAQPQLIERVRRGWHSLNYRDPAAGFVCAIFPMADEVQLVFERGAELPDPDGLLAGSGKRVRTLRFARAEEVDEDVIDRYLDLAIDVGAALRRR